MNNQVTTTIVVVVIAAVIFVVVYHVSKNGFVLPSVGSASSEVTTDGKN